MSLTGGGVALLQAGKEAFSKLELAGDEATGAQIVRRALEEPIKQIAVNAGLEGGVVVAKVRTLTAGQGLDAVTGEYVNMFEAGIIDPAKVTRSALQNAASIAALFLTTEAVIAEKPGKEQAPAGAAVQRLLLVANRSVNTFERVYRFPVNPDPLPRCLSVIQNSMRPLPKILDRGRDGLGHVDHGQAVVTGC
jgi:hypothetical protein